MHCPQCASEVDDTSVVCVRCGAGLAPAPFSATLLDADRHLEGLSGWLILVGIGLVLSPFVILGTTLATNLPLLTGAESRDFLQGHPALQALLSFEIITNLVFVALLVALNFLFFTRRRGFPAWMILYLILQLVFILGDAILAHLLVPSVQLSSATTTAIVRAVIGVVLWVPYFLQSRRVKLTFVR